VAAEDLPAGLLDQIGSGFGDAATVRYLVETQLAVTRALLATLVDRGAHLPAVRGAWEVLGWLDRTAPGAVGNALRHPYIRAWAVRCIERPGALLDPDVAHLAGLAAAAALSAGVDADLAVPLHSGSLHLPTVGTVRVPGSATGTGTLSVSGGRFTL